MILINPKIIIKENEIPYYEGCLSFPKQGIHTKRYRDIVISSTQIDGKLVFGGSDDEKVILESVCVQHEIDHLNGVRIMDRVRNTTVIVEKKIGRNHLVTIKKGDAVKVLKYKKAQKFLNDGWNIA